MVGDNKNLKELYSSCGGNYGSNEIDKKILKILFIRYLDLKISSNY